MRRTSRPQLLERNWHSRHGTPIWEKRRNRKRNETKNCCPCPATFCTCPAQQQNGQTDESMFLKKRSPVLFGTTLFSNWNIKVELPLSGLWHPTQVKLITEVSTYAGSASYFQGALPFANHVGRRGQTETASFFAEAAAEKKNHRISTRPVVM